MQKRALLILPILIVIAAALDVAVPHLTRAVIDQIVRAMQPGRSASLRTLMVAGGAIFGATALTRMLRSVYNYKSFLAASACEDEIKNAAFRNFLSLDTAFHGSVNTGEIVGALDRGGTAIFVVLYEVLGQNLLPSLLVVVGVLVSLLLKNWIIALIVAVPLPVYVLTVSGLGARMQRLEQKISTAFERVTKESYDIASNVRTVKRFAGEQRETEFQRDLLWKARHVHFRGERLWALIENTQTLIATAGRVAVITIGGWMMLNRMCSIGDYFLFIAMQDMVYGPISQLSVILPKLRRNLTRAERLFEVLDETPEIEDARDAVPVPAHIGDLEFRNVGFRYDGVDRWAVRNVSFKVPAGAMVALIGRSGSGKSTLLNLLQRLYDPEEGQILINGIDIRKFRQRSLRKVLTAVPQEVDLFSRTLRENIAYGKRGARRSDVMEAAEMAQAAGFIARTDEGLDTQVGERGMRLSGGERQRIGIARAIVHDPKILVLDEATSHLDNESERLIHQAFDEMRHGRTCFVIAHRLSTVRSADIVVVFDEGRVEAVGTHEELSETSPTYRRLYGIHVAEVRELRKKPAA